MLRKARIDALGALHQVFCRGMDRLEIFRDDVEKYNCMTVPYPLSHIPEYRPKWTGLSLKDAVKYMCSSF